MQMFYRQGDVFIARVTDGVIPMAAMRQQEPVGGRHVLALGEVTGHAHAISVAEHPEVERYATTADAVEAWLRVGPAGATVRHEEHAPIALTEGVYHVLQQVEYSPAAIRNVAD